MSSTQMDLSPLVIDRKQNIASWAEGDIDQLATRDKNRYQKRKSAIIDYFQSDLSVEEISVQHRLSAIDALETMARRCCMLHEDGRLWGFRALVPGTRVVDARAAAASAQTVNGTVPAASVRATLFSEEELVQAQQASETSEEEADPGEHLAIASKRITELAPEAGSAPGNGKGKKPARRVASKPPIDFFAVPGPATETAEAEPAVKQEEFPAPASAAVVEEEIQQSRTTERASEVSVKEEAEREKFVESTKALEIVEEGEVKQEEFPIPANVQETEKAEEIEQEEFPVSASVETEKAEEVKQEEFPVPASVEEAEKAEETEEAEEVKQEEFPVPASVEEAEKAEEVKQEEFPVLASVEETEKAEETTEAEETAEAGEVKQEKFPVPVSVEETAEAEETEKAEETAEAEEVKQEKFPVPVSVEETAEAVSQEEVEQVAFPESDGRFPVSDELELAEDLDDQDGGPTSKLPVVKPLASVANQGVEDKAGQEGDLESLPTMTLGAVQQEPAEETAATEKADRTVPLEEVKGAKEAEKVEESARNDRTEEKVVLAELDTVEVAKIMVEERLDRVAAAETIEVPAAMLNALEKADQEQQARFEETVGAPAPLPASEAAGATLPVLRELTPAKGDVVMPPAGELETWQYAGRKLEPIYTPRPPVQSLLDDSRYRITGSQTAIKRAVRRRWGKHGRQQKYQRWTRIISAAIVVSLMVILLIPLGIGLVGYNAYTNIKSVADEGVNDLLSLKALIPANKSDFTAVLDPQKLATASNNLQKAQDDFLQLQDLINRPDVESLLQQFAPQYSSKLDMARRLVQVALDVTRMGQELIGIGQQIAPVLHGSSSPLATGSNTPLVSVNEVNALEAALVHAQYYMGDIQAQMSQVDLNAIPFGTKAEKAELARYLTQIPQAQSTITQVQILVGPVAWLLGVGQARRFLVQTLDRAELRPSGGFEGQYGLLTLQNGRMSPFTLKDITLLDYAENGAELNRLPPPQYSWMNFGNWGVRDANLSADFPTTAQLVMRVFQEEGGGPIDGDIQFTPVLISQLLQLTGPLSVPQYHETVTARNLEDKLHYYQQDFNAISVERDKTGTSNASTRKAFTALVGKLLLARVHSLKFKQLMDFSKVLLQDLKTRDLQVYVTNPVAEQWLVQNGYSGAMPHFTKGNDGFMVVQANISISKATQFVHSTFDDQVTLDTQGGATHNLTITLDYSQKGPIYGFDTYTNYLRVYAPANAQFQGGTGFVNTKHTLCTPGSTKKKGSGSGTSGIGSTGTPTGCSQYSGSYPGGGRYCSSGNYSLGIGYVAGKGFVPWPVYAPSGPTEMQSDLAGYKMWGGLTQTPKNCTSTITLSWYVPHIVQKTPGQPPYQMIVGHQAGWPDTAQVEIDASQLKGVKSLKFDHTISVDTLVALAPLPSPNNQPGKPGNGTPTPALTPTATPKKP